MIVKVKSFIFKAQKKLENIKNLTWCLIAKAADRTMNIKAF